MSKAVGCKKMTLTDYDKLLDMMESKTVRMVPSTDPLLGTKWVYMGDDVRVDFHGMRDEFVSRLRELNLWS